MTSEKSTESGRVPKETADSVTDRLEETDHCKSDLIRAVFRAYDQDSTARDFFDMYMSDDVDSLGKYALNCLETGYDIGLTKQEKEEVLFGITDVISGVQNGYKPEAMAGVEKFAHIDDSLAEDAAEYLDKLGGKGSYWKD